MGGVAALAFGAEALGTEAAVVGAEALGAGALEAGALGAEAAGAGALGAEAIGGGVGTLGVIGAEGLNALELAAAAPELAAPVATGVVDAGALAPAAGALAPEAGALASAASPAVSGLSTVAGEALPGAIAEGAGVTPLTETALETAGATAAPVTEGLAVPEAAAQGAGQAAAQGAGQAAVQGTGQVASLDSGLGTAAQGVGGNLASSSGTMEAFNASAEGLATPAASGTQIASTGPVATETSLSTPAATSTAVSQAPVQVAQYGALTPANAPGVLAPGQGAFLTGPGAGLPASPLAGGVGDAYVGAGGAGGASAAELAGPAGSANIAASTGGVIDLTTPTGAAAAAGGEGLAGQAGNFLSKNASSILSALGLAANMARGQQPPKYSGNLQAQADAMNARGAQLQGYLTSGTLPPGIGDALAGAHDSAAASIRGRYAKMGMSGSSAEMQDLNNLAQTTVSQGADIANKLLATGVSQQQFAAGLYQNLMATSMQQDVAMSNAISGFTNAMAKASAVG